MESRALMPGAIVAKERVLVVTGTAKKGSDLGWRATKSTETIGLDSFG
jgi:hypothetical protein